MNVFWDVSSLGLVDIDKRFKMLTASIIRVVRMEAVSTSETSVSTTLLGTSSQKTVIFDM
jgi:hypothetical protein